MDNNQWVPLQLENWKEVRRLLNSDNYKIIECQACSEKEVVTSDSNSFLCANCQLKEKFNLEHQGTEKSKVEIQHLVRKLFKELKLVRNQISTSLDKIYYLDYDFETSNSYQIKNYTIIYWSASCCHGLKENGPDLKSWLQFLEFLYKQRREVVIRAHNGIKFDFSFYWKKIIEANLEEKDPVKAKRNAVKVIGNWVGVKWRNILHLDSYNIFSLALEDWPCTEEQKAIKKSKENTFKDPEYLNSEYSLEWYQKLAVYCDNDVEIMKTNLDGFYQEIKEVIENQIGEKVTSKHRLYRKGTNSGIALYLFRKMINKKFVSKDFRKAFDHYFPNFSLAKFSDRRDFWQQAYKGGCADVWGPNKVKGIVKEYDKVSMHPSNMFNRKLPIGIGVWVGVINNIKKIKDVGAYEIHIKHLKLRKDLCQIPLIYLRNEEGIWEGQTEVKQQVIFEVGFKWKFIAKYYEGEWKIIQGIEHETKSDLFNDYVEHFFEQKKVAKQNKEELKKESYKALLNSLYGRFGLSPKRNYFLKNQIKKPIAGMPKFLAPKRKVYYQWALTAEVMPTAFSYVPIAAVISAYSWVALMTAVIVNQDRVVYWDTDSVAVIGEFILPVNEKIGKDLGDWELKSTQTEYQCDASKWYSYLDLKGERVWKTKGLTKNSQQFLLDSQVKKIPFWQGVRTEYGVQFQRKEFELPTPERNSKRNYNRKTKRWAATDRVLAPNPNYLDF